MLYLGGGGAKFFYVKELILSIQAILKLAVVYCFLSLHSIREPSKGKGGGVGGGKAFKSIHFIWHYLN